MKTFEEILNEAKAYLEEKQSILTDWNIGSILRSICEVNAQIGSDLYKELYAYLLNSFIETSSGEFLELLIKPFGVLRKEGSKAIGTITCYINEQEGNFIIPTGTKFRTKHTDPKTYILQEDIIIEEGQTSGSGLIQAEEVGIKYNVPAYYIVEIVELPGIIKVENSNSISGGEDFETDKELKLRAIEYIPDGLSKATKSALIYGAKSVTGVSSATVKSNLLNYWERFPVIKIKFEGSWEIISDPNFYYGQRKKGSGRAILETKCKKVRIALWKDIDSGICKLYIDGVSRNINLQGETGRETVEIEFETEELHSFILDTEENYGSIEYIETLGNRIGTNIIFIDDGTGNIDWSIVRNVYNEMENWISIGESYFVKRCAIKTVDLNIKVKLNEGYYNLTEITSNIRDSAVNYINTLKMGETLYISQALKACLEVENVKNCIIESEDIEPLDYEILRSGNIGVSYV